MDSDARSVDVCNSGASRTDVHSDQAYDLVVICLVCAVAGDDTILFDTGRLHCRCHFDPPTIQ